ncbi:phosphatidylinositol phosphatase PTPRQ isoform X2 [Betta splendens]|uniref:Phosphatidylinositol phosphatase PTPRQ isoform X2 n=1 Tax=Betta splendens TaxID=158456 RepID=A0A6P7MXY6_BETSP|nr:phosphatidylinositol phosphatase PTPRQ isoform X2 [Betta splendens]
MRTDGLMTFPMGGTARLCLLASFFQVVLLTCEQHSGPVKVELLFDPFTSGRDPDSYTVTCRTASNHLVYVDPISPSACSPKCRMSLLLVRDQMGYNITVRASKHDMTLEAKSFHFVPVSLSSLRLYSTTTTALLTWKLDRCHSLSSLSLYNTNTQSVTHVLGVHSSEAESRIEVKGLQPGTRFKANVGVSTFLEQLHVILKQQLSIGVETARCPAGWLASGRSCFTVRGRGLSWSDARQSCKQLAPRSHLADVKTQDDLLFLSSHLLSQNSPLLLWTGPPDQQEKGRSLRPGGSSSNSTNTIDTLGDDMATCFVLQRNATGPGYFLTPFFCNIPLPFICQSQNPVVPSSFSFDLVQVTERQVELRWSDLSPLMSVNYTSLEIFLQYQEEENGEWAHEEDKGKSQGSIKKIVKVPISVSSRGVTVAGLYPGSIYSFTLKASHPAGASWSLGQTRTAYTRPLSPQNITVGSITVSQISVHWMLPQAHYMAGWTFVVRYLDTSSGREWIVGMTNVSRSSETPGSHTVVIGGMEPYRKYMVEVNTVTLHGIESCAQVPLTAQTAASPPSGLKVTSATGNLTVCWSHPPDGQPDGYNVTFHPLHSPGAFSLWINQSSPGARRANLSICIDLGTFTPGETYKIGVVSLRGEARSQSTSTMHTTAPLGVPVAVPLRVGPTSAQLYVQHPQLGLMDGASVCVCPGLCAAACEGPCEHLCTWYSLAAGVHVITLSNLSPGSEYQLKVHSTSRAQRGPPFYSLPFKTGLSPPSRLREGSVTDSSVELLWDPAPGEAHSYEVICLNCDPSHMVQKVFSQSAVFSNLTPGRLYRFAVRTEKESFADSSPVSINITAAPSPVDLSLVNKSASSINISWGTVRGELNGLSLSIQNQTSTQELMISRQAPRSHTFKGLGPGSQYLIEVASISGKRRSKPASMTVQTIPAAPQEVALPEQVVTSVFVTWRAPPGQVEGYRLAHGLWSVDKKSWSEVFVQSTAYEISDLIPGSDYGVSIQSVLGSDTSQTVSREFSTRPAGLCSLHVDNVNASSVALSWDAALGEFDFHRVTVANASVTNTLVIPREARVAVVTGLADGCSYNVSAERVRGVTTGSAAFLTVTTVPAPVRGFRFVNVSAHSFSLLWEQAAGCVDRYQVSLLPNQGTVAVRPAAHGYIQANVNNVSPGTQYNVMVTAASSSNTSPGVSRMISTNDSVPGPPVNLVGDAVGSNGILLSWTMPDNARNVEVYVIRYREVCPYPDVTFTELTRNLFIPETLITDFISGSTYFIQVAAVSPAGKGPFSEGHYVKTAESPPGLVTNLTAFAHNHTFVVVTWFLPHRINGLITKFAVKVKFAQGKGGHIRTVEINAEDIMTVALPHCNDAADILSRATLSPLDITASSPPITLSAVPPSASWSVPISVGIDQLRPYTAYLFEVSAFTSEGEGQIASTMVRMPESAPEDPPQNFAVLSMTSRAITVSWSSPRNITGKFTYVLYLFGPAGYLYENNTADLRFAFMGLTPFTRYKVVVRAKAAGEVGPAAEHLFITPAEAPSAVRGLIAVAKDSVSILVSWRIPAQPNGPITHYRLLVQADKALLQDITLTAENTTLVYDDVAPPSSQIRSRRSEEPLTTSPSAFTATVSKRTLPDSSFTTADHVTSTYSQPMAQSMVTEKPGASYASASHTSSSHTQSAASEALGSSAHSFTTVPPATLPSWLTTRSDSEDMTSDSSPSGLTPNQPRLSTRDAMTAFLSTRSAASSVPIGVKVKKEAMNLTEELSYLVSELDPFTEYMFRVSASTTVGEGPATYITEKTREQVPSSVLDVSYQNISSTSILVTWAPPLNPNGRITHYTVYGLNLHRDQALSWKTNNTSILITDLDKYTGYKLRVAASTAVGESSLSEEDDVFVYTSEDEPDSPPVDLTVVDTSPSTTTLTWSAPEKANGLIQYYEVLYENESFSALVNASTNRVTLTNLRPFSLYNVSVRAYTRYGHGNQTSDTLQLLSGEDVPGSPPYGLAFESLSPSEVNVTWRPPLLPNGVLTHYSLELWNSTHSVNLTTATHYIYITHLRKYAHYRVSVLAHTRVGAGNHSSEPLNITTLEDAPGTPPQFLHAIKLSDYEVKLSWQPPAEANSDILYYSVRVWNETTELRQNVTGTSVVIAVDSQSASVFSWTRLEPFDPPGDMTVVNVTASSVTVLWSKPTEPNGIIVHCSIFYSQNNTEAEQTVPVSVPPAPDSPLSYTLTCLVEGTNYTIWMTSSTVQGDGGVRSEPLVVILSEYVPGDSVRNLTAQIFSSTAIIVSWEPPLEPNGRPYYLLTLQEASPPADASSQGSPAVNNTINGTTSDVIYLFTKLRKYFPYVLTVIPATGAGLAYNHNSTMELRTDDDVPSSAPLLVSIRNVSSTSIAVTWEPPLEANGEIKEYTLTLYGPGGSSITQTPNTSFVFTKLLPYTAYNLTITAATRKGPGPALPLQLHTDEGGPMSPPLNLTIYNHTAVSVWLSWEPPLEPNGVVIQYGFRILDLITHTVTHQNSTGPSTTEHLSGFRPHSSYEISVYSYTRVGHGDQFSSPVTFTTNESASDAVGNLSCSGVSWDSIRLYWEPPENPNGQIIEYEVLVRGGVESRTLHTDLPGYNMTGLAPDQEYAITVAAVNSAGAGEGANCTASTLAESVPAAPRFLAASQVTPSSVTLDWAPPLSIPGQLRAYNISAQLLFDHCSPSAAQGELPPNCVDREFTEIVNASDSGRKNHTLRALAKYREYRFRVAAVTNAGVGEHSPWIYQRTSVGNPDYPPRDLNVTPTSNSLHVEWKAPDVLSGPTSYLAKVVGPGLNVSLVRAPGQLMTVVVGNLTAFTQYSVTVIAFTGPVEHAASEGKAVGPHEVRTLEEVPKDPPKNVTVSLIPEEVNSVKVTFVAPEEPNGNITVYFVCVYDKDQLVMNISLDNVQRHNNTLTAVIDGLKGGQNYSIKISARNGVGSSPPSQEVHITTGIKAPAKPTQKPQAVHGPVATVTQRSFPIRKPACFYSDDHGPIAKIQVIVAESVVKDIQNVTNWKQAFIRPAPYLTDNGFKNPPCPSRMAAAGAGTLITDADIYVVGEDDACEAENNTENLCNGRLKPNTAYVFKFRATNIKGQYTDSDYSDNVRTTGDKLLTREEQIILGVLLSFCLAVLLIIIICSSVKLHQRKKEGGTYSPREAEIIETKCKLDQLIAVADLDLKQEKLNRLLSYRKSLKPINKKSFLQHIEDLCANDNAKFQEEFAELPKLLQDLATTDADLPWNKSKNRFPNIKPYNNNRVKLLSEPGTAGSDYINASFVSGYLCPNEFIATQGPLPGTVADFWRMIWETGTRTIAMLTQCYEKGRIRCHKYWPEDNKPMTVFSDILISKVSEEVLPDWTIRTLKVEKHGHLVLVRHLNYTSWPEHGVPDSSSTLIKFVRAVRAHRHDNTPIVVHCSAGVGRTGVFMALDHLIQHVRDHDFVDIYGLVAELRSERMCMVQNLAQYIFLHQSMLELLNNKGNSQSIWFVSYSALEKMDSLEAMEGDVELEWEETTM